jgi:hypothetical protein
VPTCSSYTAESLAAFTSYDPVYRRLAAADPHERI